MWVAGGDDGTVVRVDPDGPRKAKRFKTGSRPTAIAVAGGSVWAAADAPQTAHRGGTLRALVPRSRESLVPMDWLAPAAYTTWATFQLSSLAYDGLVAYRRVEGAAGATIVGALATTAPRAERRRAQLRLHAASRLRYSDGTPVRPDGLPGLDGALPAGHSRPLREEPSRRSTRASSVPGSACARRPARCDLSRGIETDAGARTITIHLTAPDAGASCTSSRLPFAFVVPAGSPARATTGPTPPGTGPYRVAAGTRSAAGSLVRNPHFRRDPGARPTASPIGSRSPCTTSATVEPQIDDVQRGDADVAVVADPFGSLVCAERLRALIAGSPGRVTASPRRDSDWMFLNVAAPPFDDPRVRQAVNLAIRPGASRRAGREARSASPPARSSRPRSRLCALLPLHREPAGRGWRAPDLERARKLVAASGRAGERVRHRGIGLPGGHGSWTAATSRAARPTWLPRVPVLLPITTSDLQREPRAQAGFVGASADSISPSTFIDD